jgi:diguanylate cyclase (GGDEF)-like protein
MRQTIKKQLKIYLPALLNVALFGTVVFWFILNDVQQEIEDMHRRLVLVGCVVFAAVLLVSGYIVFQGILFEKERNRMARKLKNLTSTDPLTGALNRRHFWRASDMELHRHHRYFRELAILVMDIDHFKRINDTFGHPAGDMVLRELVNSCVKNLRKSDIFGRIGGEEFAILLVETQAEASVEVADRLRQQLAAKQIIVDGGIPINFTVSIGVSHARREDESLDDLIKRADAALEQAKSKGCNRVESQY